MLGPLIKNFIVVSAVFSALSHAAQPTTSPTAAASNDFGYRLLQKVGTSELNQDTNKNIFISPISASIALEMLLNAAAANSATQSQIATTLGVHGLTLAQINHANKDLIMQLQQSQAATPQNTSQGTTPEEDGSFKLMIANSLWGNSDTYFKFRDAYVHLLHGFYQATARSLNFSDTKSADILNTWASDNTNKKIPFVIGPDALRELEFVLMNATYFKANWASEFWEKATDKNESFTRGDGTLTKIEMMKGQRFGYTLIGNYQVMELHYMGYRAAMYVVMPHFPTKMSDVLADSAGPTSPAFWSKVTAQHKEVANFSFPKFSFSYEIKLNQALSALGMIDAFSPRADFSAGSLRPTQVSLVKQNTFIKVDEKGTEAAAVTTIGPVAASAPILPTKIHTMRVDRPFVISIVEKDTNTVLFTGAISDIK